MSCICRGKKQGTFSSLISKEADMSKTMAFTVFCLENYKHAKQLTGKEVDALFRQYDVYGYLHACYDALHTTGHLL